MVFEDVFLSPLGLLGLLGLVPLLLLYLIRPDPKELALPTVRFLDPEVNDGGRTPILDRLRRTPLLALQIVVIVLLALSLASPYVVAQRSTAETPTVVVVDASASMATQGDGGTRFARAVSLSGEAVSESTTVVTASTSPRVVVANASAETAREALGALRVTDAPGDLRAAVSRAAALAGPGARVVVVSDFVDETDWRGAVTTARARGVTVTLRQVAGGGSDNVGIVGQRFVNQRVTFSVKNTGEEPAEREITFAGETRTLSLQPGDVGTATFPIPVGGGRAELSPGDSFPTDDVAFVAAPRDPTVDVLLLTSRGNPNLATALSVIRTVNVTVDQPPTRIRGEYDVIVFGQVRGERLRNGTVAVARNLVEDGGGVVVQGQADLGAVGYGRLLAIEPGGLRNTTGVDSVTESELTRGIEFPAPDRHVNGTLRGGQALVTTTDGSPLIATASRGEGRVLYDGYVPNHSAFRFDYRYPIFWKRAIEWTASRPTLRERNRLTGDRLQFAEPTAVRGPAGIVTGRTVPMTAVGFYETDERRLAASLFSPAESNVTAPAIEDARLEDPPDVATATVQRDLTPLLLAVLVLALVGELLLLRRRGDL